VCTPPGELAEWCARAGIEVLALGFARREPGSWAPALATVGAAMRDGDYALVHAHSSFSGALVRGQPRAPAPPVVFQPHGWSFLAVSGPARRASVLAERALARRTQLLVCVSDEELAIGRHESIRARHELVIRNGVDFDPPPRRLDPAAPPAPAIVGCVARLAEQKGIDVLLRALADPVWPADAMLEIVGDGPQRTRLATLAARLGVDRRVRFLGRSSDVGAELARWSLFVLPARYEAGAPIALLEALAAGLPAVATDVAGVRGLGGPGSGVPAPVAINDAPGLARAVARALRDWPTTVRAEAAMRTAAAQRYQLGAQADAMADAYRSLL
jgi:glycosyltransferase involved in cell wall biosynthesis